MISTGTRTLRSSATSASAGTPVQSAAVAAARLKVERATDALREAEAALADARSTREVAEAVAERMQGLADEAQDDADAAGRVYLAAAHGDGTTISSMPAVFGAGNDLLAGLGGVARVAQIAGDADELLAIAELRTEEAERRRSGRMPHGQRSTRFPSRRSKARSPTPSARSRMPGRSCRMPRARRPPRAGSRRAASCSSPTCRPTRAS